MVLFVLSLIIKSFKKYHSLLRTGFIILIIMQLTILFGYGLFPLSGDETEMNFQNIMHIIVVFITITSSFLIGFGYLKQEKNKSLGKLTLVMTILITTFGALNPIGMGLQLNVLALIIIRLRKHKIIQFHPVIDLIM